MKSMSHLLATELILLTAVLFLPQIKAADTQNQSLGFSKQFFFYEMEEKIDFFNGLMNTDIYLEKEETYYPLPDRRDGWQWKLPNGIAIVAVGGQENDLEEALFIGKTPGNDTLAREMTTGICAFEWVIWTETEQRQNANDWVAQQLHSHAPETEKKIGNRVVRWVYTTQDGYPAFGIRVFGEPKIQPGLPWWTVLGIISGTIGLSTAGYKLINYFHQKSRARANTKARQKKGDFGINYSVGVVSSGLPKSPYFNLVSIAK